MTTSADTSLSAATAMAAATTSTDAALLHLRWLASPALPLGQSAGRRILARLSAEIPAAIVHAQAVLACGRQSFSPMLAILPSRHEVQYSRLFRS